MNLTRSATEHWMRLDRREPGWVDIVNDHGDRLDRQPVVFIPVNGNDHRFGVFPHGIQRRDIEVHLSSRHWVEYRLDDGMLVSRLDCGYTTAGAVLTMTAPDWPTWAVQDKPGRHEKPPLAITTVYP